MTINFTQASSAYANTANMKTMRESTPAASMPTNEGMKSDFSELVSTALTEAKQAGYQSEGLSASAIAGESQMQDVAIAMTNAELTLQTVIGVRDKMVGAYQDIIKMPI